MASLGYRRGGWELYYREPNGRQRVERFPGPKGNRPPAEARERLAAVERELRWREFVSPEQRTERFGELYEKWWRSRRVSASRRYTDEGRARRHVLPHWRDWRIGDIRPSDIDDWVAELATKMNPWSVRHCYLLLRGPLRRAVKDGVIPDPCIDIVLPKKPEIRKTFDDVLTAEELDRLVDAMVNPGERYASLRTAPRYAALVFMGGWLGPRGNEALGVRLCDVNPLRKEITFGRIVVNQNGGTSFLEKMSKTEDSRTIPVPTPVMDVLLEHIERYVDTSRRDAFLFLTTNGRHLQRTHLSHMLRRAAQEAGLGDRGLHWLMLRHTAASLMFDAGLSLFEVQQRLGHKDPTLTAQVYTHLMRERFEEGRERMEAYMTEKRQPTKGERELPKAE
jgi:integrase